MSNLTATLKKAGETVTKNSAEKKPQTQTKNMGLVSIGRGEMELQDLRKEWWY